MPRQVDSSPFRVGENVGATPGQVVFRNEVLEIIQYTPTTPTVRSVPLLVVWSVINRHYILDLAKDRSFIEYALEPGAAGVRHELAQPQPGARRLEPRHLRAGAARRHGRDPRDHRQRADRHGGSLRRRPAARRGHGAPDQHRATTGSPTPASASARSTCRSRTSPGSRCTPRCIGAARRGHRGRRRRRRARDRRRVLVAAAERAGLEPVGQQLPDGQGRRRSTTSSPGTTTPPACPAPCSATCSTSPWTTSLATPGGLTLLGTPVRPRRDHGRHLRRRRRDRPPRPVAGRVPLAPSSSAATRPSSSRAAATSSTWSTRRATRRRTSGPDRSPARTPTAWLAGSVKQQGTWWSHWAEWALARSGDERPAPKTLGSRRHPADRGRPGTLREGASERRHDPRHRRPADQGAGAGRGSAPAADRRPVEPGAAVGRRPAAPGRVHARSPSTRPASVRPPCRSGPTRFGDSPGSQRESSMRSASSAPTSWA